jgi:hypothetical protein
MNIVFTDKTIIDSLVDQQRDTPTPQAIDWGRRKPLEEFIIEVDNLISSF